ncbi:hypothetical protein Pnap_4416 (plasmid) [Polaromonas naphthalenivorans CJ2]|uniref:Uncharacterized protein n=1 Tax=Polaromonas naphthalenivorans (strain CJ2) TaxID=365044 RepID=A1VVL6_POLNA|nr:hypothetical protein Pnap_4416 [Polaromonas naphthalenivorans CJ2]
MAAAVQVFGQDAGIPETGSMHQAVPWEFVQPKVFGAQARPHPNDHLHMAVGKYGARLNLLSRDESYFAFWLQA